MAEIYYKDQTITLLEAFCATVECKNNMTAAAGKLHSSPTAISLQIKSLEYFLKYDLFIRGAKLSITKKGEEYYPVAKKAIDEFKAAFNKEITPSADLSKIRFFKDYINEKIKKFINCLKYQKTTFRFRYILLFLLTLIGFCVYKINSSNYFFDRTLYELASPKLQTLMRDGHYVISEEIVCSFDVTQMNLDMYELIEKMIDNGYKNLSVLSILVSDYPLIGMRFTGDENIDKVFKNREFSMCETDRSYIAGKKVIKSSKKLFTNNKNFKFYNLYRKSLNDCLHCNYFEENIKKYPNNLFGEKTDKIANTPDLRVWIIKIGNYYYVLAITNIISVEESVKFKNKNEKKERNLYWKKMTQDELMGYSNGTYWKLIEQNNIRFN